MKEGLVGEMEREAVDYVSRIRPRNARIGVIGLGYVGLSLVFEFCRSVFHVTGFDIDADKVRLLKEGRSYI